MKTTTTTTGKSITEPRSLVEFREFILKKIFFVASYQLPAYMLDNLDAHVWLDDVAERLIVQLRSHVLAEPEKIREFSTIVKLRVPRGLRDYFVLRFDRYLPGWFKRRFPVRWKYEERVVSVKVTGCIAYPEFNRHVRDLGTGVEIITGTTGSDRHWTRHWK